MDQSHHRVFIVLDTEFGTRIADLPAESPIWIVDSPHNRPFVEAFWKERPRADQLTGITLFHWNPEISLEQNLLDQLDTIDLHHGRYSADPPYGELEALGVPPTERIQIAVADLGFGKIIPTSAGFIARRR